MHVHRPLLPSLCFGWIVVAYPESCPSKLTTWRRPEEEWGEKSRSKSSRHLDWFTFTMEAYLWVSLWRCFQMSLTSKGGPILNVGSTIPWAETPEWIKRRKRAEHCDLSLASCVLYDVTGCLKSCHQTFRAMMDCSLKLWTTKMPPLIFFFRSFISTTGKTVYTQALQRHRNTKDCDTIGETVMDHNSQITPEIPVLGR